VFKKDVLHILNQLFMMEMVFEIILLYLLNYPGAYVRWVFYRRRRKFKDLLNQDSHINLFVSVVMIIIIVILCLFF
jgi:uncharacterized membrane protein YidH (DUF202 family)